LKSDGVQEGGETGERRTGLQGVFHYSIFLCYVQGKKKKAQLEHRDVRRGINILFSKGRRKSVSIQACREREEQINLRAIKERNEKKGGTQWDSLESWGRNTQYLRRISAS